MINFQGTAKPIEDIDLPRIGSRIGVGEDPIHALIEVETSGDGFDKHGRPKMLFEPHRFYANLKSQPEKRAQAVKEGLAYRDWGTQRYPKDSYPRLEEAMKIDERAALKSASWGLGQIMGENYKMAGFESVEDMVIAMTEDEDNHLEAMISFLIASGIDDDLRRIEKKIQAGQKVTIADVVPIVRTYNGAGFKKNQYDTRFLNALNRWIKIKDTPYAASTNMKELAEAESNSHELSQAGIGKRKIVFEDETADDEQPDIEKGVTTSPKTPADETEGTPPPIPAVPVVASRPSIKSTAASILALIMGPLAYLGIDAKEAAAKAGDFAQNNIALALKIAAGFAFVIIAYWIWNKAMDRAHQRTLKVMDAAADQKKNNLRLISPTEAAKEES